MTSITHNQLRRSRAGAIAFAALCLFGAVLAGCPKGPVKPQVVRTRGLMAPNPPQVAAELAPPEISVAPPNDVAVLALAVIFDVPPEKPPAPRHVVPAIEPGPEKPAAPPQIAPQISPQDQARAQADTSSFLQTARQNLNSVSGRRMNATQQDLADKISSFMDQARDAMTVGDWIRARNLADKARVLSIELVHSF